MKKHLVAIMGGAILVALAAFVGSGYLNGRRAEHKAAAQRSAVHSLTQQELAAAVARCESPPEPGRPEGNHTGTDAIYCKDVAREMDDRPLEIVKERPRAGPLLPSR